MSDSALDKIQKAIADARPNGVTPDTHKLVLPAWMEHDLLEEVHQIDQGIMPIAPPTLDKIGGLFGYDIEWYMGDSILIAPHHKPEEMGGADDRLMNPPSKKSIIAYLNSQYDTDKERIAWIKKQRRVVLQDMPALRSIGFVDVLDEVKAELQTAAKKNGD